MYYKEAIHLHAGLELEIQSSCVTKPVCWTDFGWNIWSNAFVSDRVQKVESSLSGQDLSYDKTVVLEAPTSRLSI